MKIEFIKKHRFLFNVCIKLHNLFFNRVRIKKGNIFKTGLVYLKNCRIHVDGLHNEIQIADFTRLINCEITVLGNNSKILIDNRCYLNELSIYFEDNSDFVHIGEHTSMDGKIELACIEGTSIIIGKDSMFSRNIHIRTGDAHLILDPKGDRINYSKNVMIGDHVWVGTGVLITKGCSVGAGSVVGAGAIVTGKEFPKNSIIAGVPAKVIRENVFWKRERYYVTQNDNGKR